MKKNNLYKYSVAIAAILIAAMAALFSITGLALLFSGAYVLIAIAMGSLEFGKLVVASFLYRYWKIIPKFLAPYLIVGLVVLMLLTSLGIFGYLTNAYQGMSIKLDKNLQKIEILKSEKTRMINDKKRLIDEKSQLSKQMQTELSGLVVKEETRYLDSKYRNRVVKRYQPTIDDKEKQISSMTKRLTELAGEIGEQEIKSIDTGVDVGPIVFVARLFETSIDVVARYLILIIIFVFDPMAVALVIAYNIILKEEDSKPKKNKKIDIEKIKKPIKKTKKTKKKREVKLEQQISDNKNENSSETRIEEKDEGGVRRIEQLEIKNDKEITIEEVLEEQLNPDNSKKIIIQATGSADRRIP